jgi:hypothetical protein
VDATTNPLRAQKQFAGPKSARELPRGKNPDAILRAPGLGFQTDNRRRLEAWMVLLEAAQALEVVA